MKFAESFKKDYDDYIRTSSQGESNKDTNETAVKIAPAAKNFMEKKSAFEVLVDLIVSELLH